MELSAFLETKQFPGKVIFAKVWGSRSHNTHKESSDWDFSGVYLAPTESFLGLKGVAETVTNNENSKPDYSFHEAKKFCNLLLVGNPGIVEMLFTDRLCMETADWLSLKKHRKSFLTKAVVRQYLGYAAGQLNKLKAGKGLHTTGGKYNEKWAYHLMRSLLDADKIICGVEPVVWKEPGAERNYLMQIRENAVKQEEIYEEGTRLLDELYKDLETSQLPEKGDESLLEKWLIGLRK